MSFIDFGAIQYERNSAKHMASIALYLPAMKLLSSQSMYLSSILRWKISLASPGNSSISSLFRNILCISFLGHCYLKTELLEMSFVTRGQAQLKILLLEQGTPFWLHKPWQLLSFSQNLIFPINCIFHSLFHGL